MDRERTELGHTYMLPLNWTDFVGDDCISGVNPKPANIAAAL